MYKAIKDDKIIAISDTDSEFFCLVKDEVVEDTEHTTADYDQYNGEYLLKSEIPLPTNEEQSEKRAEAYAQKVDPLHAEKMRKTILGTWTEEKETEYVLKIKELSDKIVQEYPYSEESNETQI